MIGSVGYTKAIPFLLPEFPVFNGAASVLPGHIDALRQIVTDGYREADDRFSFFDDIPTPFIKDPRKAVRVVQQRRVFAGLTRREMAAIVDRAEHNYSRVENGHLMRVVNDGVGQRLCALFNIRANLLPFAGQPLRDPEAILKEVLNRCVALGILPDSLTFEKYVGMSFEELAFKVRHENPLAGSLREILIDCFHLRLWPGARGKKITEITHQEFVIELKEMMKEWQMTRKEFASIYGVTDRAINYLFSKPENVYGLKCDVARDLGYKLKEDAYYTIDSLPEWPQHCYVDNKLFHAIWQQMCALGWTKNRVCSEAGVNLDFLTRIEPELKPLSQISDDDISFGYRESLLRVCSLLKIKLYTYDNLPEDNYEPTGDWRQDRVNLGQLILNKRKLMRLTYGELLNEEQLRSVRDTVEKIEKGLDVQWSGYAAIAQLLNLFNIKVNYKTVFNEPLKINHLIEEEKESVIEYRYHWWLLSVKGDLDVDGLDNRVRQSYLKGAVSLDDTNFIQFLKRLNIHNKYFNLESLPEWPDACYLDNKLFHAIWQQMCDLGWDADKLCRVAGIKKSVMKGLESELKPLSKIDLDSVRFRYSTSITKLCDLLKIKLYTLDNLPEETYQPTGNWDVDRKQLGLLIKRKRLLLRLAPNGFRNLEGVSVLVDTVQKIENGEPLLWTGYAALSQLLSLFNISIDYSSVITSPYLVDEQTPPRRLAEQIQYRYHWWVLMGGGDYQRDGLDQHTRYRFLKGRSVYTNIDFILFLKKLNIHLRKLQSVHSWLQSVKQAMQRQKMTKEELMDRVGLSAYEVNRILNGNFSLDEEFVQAVGYAVLQDHITTESLSLYSDKEKWNDEMEWRFGLTGHSFGSFAQVALDIEGEKNTVGKRARDMLKKDYSNKFANPYTLSMAINLKLFNWTIVQLLLEQYRGATDKFYRETGIPKQIIESHAFMRGYHYSDNGSVAAVISRRQAMLRMALAGHELSLRQKTFLIETGGDEEMIKKAHWHVICYLYSLGDKESAALFCREHHLSEVGFKEKYRQWLTETYGIRALQLKIKPKGRKYPIMGTNLF